MRLLKPFLPTATHHQCTRAELLPKEQQRPGNESRQAIARERLAKRRRCVKTTKARTSAPPIHVLGSGTGARISGGVTWAGSSNAASAPPPTKDGDDEAKFGLMKEEVY